MHPSLIKNIRELKFSQIMFIKKDIPNIESFKVQVMLDSDSLDISNSAAYWRYFKLNSLF